MAYIIDLILMRDAASFVFCVSIAVLVAVSVLVLNPPPEAKPRLVSPPTIATPGLMQGPQLLREGRPVETKKASSSTMGSKS